MTARLLPVVVQVVLALSTMLAASACTRPCESPANCIRTCSCLNEVTNLRLDCDVAFRCEGDTRTCEAAHDEQSCDDICRDYAGTGRCGVQRCASDAECRQTISCPLVDGNGTPTGQFADCTLNFRCQPEFEACQPRSTVDPAILCANECVSGVIPEE